MPNPFDELDKKSKAPLPEYELVGGAFTCQHCWDVVHEAKYFEAASLLTWKCNEGHISSMEYKFE